MDDNLLTHHELALRLKVSVKTVRRAAAVGQIPGLQVRGRVRFYWPEVLASLPSAAPVLAARRMRARGLRQSVPIVEELKAMARDYYLVPDELAARRERKERES